LEGTDTLETQVDSFGTFLNS